MNTSTISNTLATKRNVFLIAVILMMGLAAMMAGMRIVESQELTGQALFEAWATDWLVIWASAVIALFAVLLPLIARFKNYVRSDNEAAMWSELMRTQPSLRQEMMAMQSRDLDEVENFDEALEPLGGLQAQRSQRPGGFSEDFKAGGWNTRDSLLRLM